MSVDDISQWLNSHQLLVVSILIPLVSASVAASSSWYSTRRALKVERTKMAFDGILKVAEFRQNWINSLRDEMAEFQSHGVYPGADPTKERMFYRCGTKIELLMNPNDPDFNELQSQMYGFLKATDGSTIDKYSRNAEFVSLCQRILKREWDRLKSDLHSGSVV